METLALESPAATLARESSFQELYESAFPDVASFVAKMNGSFQDAKDIFHDALLIYIEKSQHPDFEIAVLPQKYILGISKHLWLRKFSAVKKHVTFNAMESSISIPVDFYPSVQISRVLRLLEIAGKSCLDLLRACYYDKLTMKDAASRFGYRNEHSVTVQKYKCLMKLRSVVKEKSISYEDFFE